MDTKRSKIDLQESTQPELPNQSKDSSNTIDLPIPKSQSLDNLNETSQINDKEESDIEGNNSSFEINNNDCNKNENSYESSRDFFVDSNLLKINDLECSLCYR